MTANDMTTPQAPLEKSSGADPLRETIGFGAERLTALEVEGLTGRNSSRSESTSTTVAASGTRAGGHHMSEHANSRGRPAGNPRPGGGDRRVTLW